MLIDTAIEEAKEKGLLFPVHPIAGWVGEPRAFLMCKPLRDELEKNKLDLDESVRARWAKLEGSMQHFVGNGYMTRNRIKQLEPAKFENWELINKRPKPSLRVFGSFAKPDLFIGTHVKERNKLKGKFSVEFEIERIQSEQIWKATGLPINPKTGRPAVFSDAPEFRYEAYITENASEKIQVPL